MDVFVGTIEIKLSLKRKKKYQCVKYSHLFVWKIAIPGDFLKISGGVFRF